MPAEDDGGRHYYVKDEDGQWVCDICGHAEEEAA